MGVYFEAPRGRNFIPPPFYTPPTPTRVFLFFRGGGVGVKKLWPRRKNNSKVTLGGRPQSSEKITQK